MSTENKYQDKRSSFFQKFFDSGLPYDQYLKTGELLHRERWHSYAKSFELSDSQQQIISTFKRKLNVLVMSGIWCGDCARQGPMLRSIEVACPLIAMRFLDNKEAPELQEELRMNGAQKVPIVVAMSEDFYELSRFGDRHLSVYRRKARLEFGPACDAGIVLPTQEELAEELGEWVSYFERLQLMLRLAPALRARYGD